MSARLQEPRRKFLTHVLVVASYALLTAVMTWPLVLHFDSAVLGPPGDNLEYVWKMWWFKHALLERRVSPLYDPDIFYPFGYPLALSETTVVHTVMGAPLTALWGETVAYNAVVYLSFVVSGYGVYLLCRGLACSALASWIAGLAFAYCPYRLAHLGAGHLPLMGTGWMALFFLAAEGLIRAPSWRRGLAVGLFYALTALSSWYYALMLGLMGGLYLLLRARGWSRALWPRLALGGALAAVLIGPAALPMIRLYAEGQARYGFSLAYVDRWSASPLDFLYPNAMHPWWGEALTKAYYQNIHENLLYLGLPVIVLSAIGFWARRKERVTRAVIWLAVVAFVLALGTSLHVAGEPVYLRVPAQVEYQFSRAMYVLTGRLALNRVDYSPLRREGAIIIPLPTLLLYLFVPMMSAMRVWTRFGIFVMLGASVLAAWGIDTVLRRLTAPWRGLAAATLALLVLVDVAVVPYPYGYTEVRGQPVDHWLAEEPRPSPVAHFPLDKTWYGWMLYPQRVHRQPIAYGYGTFAPLAYREAAGVLGDWPSEEAHRLLREWGIQYVLVGARSYGDAWPTVQQRIASLDGIQPVGVFEDRPLHHSDRLLVHVRPSPDVPPTELVSGARVAYLHDEMHVYAIQ